MKEPTPADLDALQEAEAKATPGPWQWYGNTKVHSCYLSTVYGGRVFVMQFDRWGTGCAQPTFQWPVGSGSGLMYPLAKLPEEAGPNFEVDYRRDFVGIKHPDAQIICLARNALPGLISMSRRTLAAEADATSARICRNIDHQTIARLEAHIAREAQGHDPDAPGPAFERWRCRAHAAEAECERLRAELEAERSDPKPAGAPMKGWRL